MRCADSMASYGFGYRLDVGYGEKVRAAGHGRDGGTVGYQLEQSAAQRVAYEAAEATARTGSRARAGC
jgi:hypothetical protein